MAHIVILGAGLGGMPAAYEMRNEVGKQHEVTVINASEYFQFVPSNPWVGVGWRKHEDITIPIEPALKSNKINFIAQAVTQIEPNKNRLTLANGETVGYDYLIIATGPKLAFEEVEGLGPAGFTHSICTLAHAEKAYGGYQELLDNPGPVVMGAAQGASCFGPAYEYSMIVETALRQAKRRDKVPMTYITSEPYIGHLGLGGVGDSKGMMESAMRQRHIKWITNAKVIKVENGKMFVDEHNNEAEVIKQHEVPFNYSMMLPAFKGVDAVANVTELCNPRGFVKVDEYQRNPTHKNIYAAGVCIAISMVTAIVHNIANEVNGKEPTEKGTWNAICLADFGDTGAAFVAMPQIPPRNLTWFKTGKWVHAAKIAFEKYFLGKMKKGSSEPMFEKYILKLLGIERLK